MSSNYEAEILSVHHWTDRLFSFTTTRDDGFRFLAIEGRPLMRAYSIASSPYESHLEFLSIKVPDGPLTSRLQNVKPGDKLLIGGKPTGTLLIQNLMPGRTLYLLASGTGLAPFLSIVRDPEPYERFERVVLVHGCRLASELAYEHYLSEQLPRDEYIGEQVSRQLMYYPTVTREAYRHQGRIPALIEAGRLTDDLGLPALDPWRDRCMVCGSPAMLAETRSLLERLGFYEGSMARQGSYVIERAFVER